MVFEKEKQGIPWTFLNFARCRALGRLVSLRKIFIEVDVETCEKS